jgi:hypothetical protein
MGTFILPDLDASVGANVNKDVNVNRDVMGQFRNRTIGIGLQVLLTGRPEIPTSHLATFLWDYIIKELEYVQRPFDNLADLKRTITDVFEEVRNSAIFREKLNCE